MKPHLTEKDFALNAIYGTPLPSPPAKKKRDEPTYNLLDDISNPANPISPINLAMQMSAIEL